LSQSTRVTDRRTDGQTDGQTDGRTDRNLLTIPRLHYMQRGKNSEIYEAENFTHAQTHADTRADNLSA